MAFFQSNRTELDEENIKKKQINHEKREKKR